VGADSTLIRDWEFPRVSAALLRFGKLYTRRKENGEEHTRIALVTLGALCVEVWGAAARSSADVSGSVATDVAVADAAPIFQVRALA
jgi:hypothetical protein